VTSTESPKPPEEPEDTDGLADADDDAEVEELMSISPEKWAEARRRTDEAERERTKRIFGDQPPTVYVDRYEDM
jgi:hypothetical protein